MGQALSKSPKKYSVKKEAAAEENVPEEKVIAKVSLENILLFEFLLLFKQYC